MSSEIRWGRYCRRVFAATANNVRIYRSTGTFGEFEILNATAIPNDEDQVV